MAVAAAGEWISAGGGVSRRVVQVYAGSLHQWRGREACVWGRARVIITCTILACMYVTNYNKFAADPKER